MDLRTTINRRIENIEVSLKNLEDIPPNEQVREELISLRYYLQGLLQQTDAPVVEQEVSVELTLSVDVSISKENIKERILAFLGQSDGITPMAITVKEEAEIYGNE